MYLQYSELLCFQEFSLGYVLEFPTFGQLLKTYTMIKNFSNSPKEIMMKNSTLTKMQHNRQHNKEEMRELRREIRRRKTKMKERKTAKERDLLKERRATLKK